MSLLQLEPERVKDEIQNITESNSHGIHIMMHQHLKDKGAHEKSKPLAVMEDYKQYQYG